MAGYKPESERHEDVIRTVQFKTGRQCSDHDERAAVETDRLADNRRVAAKLLVPECIADCSRGHSSGLIVRRTKEPADLRFDAENLKEIPVHTSSIDGYGRINSGYIEDVIHEAGSVVERMCAIAPVNVIGVRDEC